ncbi:MAG: glycosyltransferase family 4 protein [Patescibacteria group bacterium]
MNIAQLVSNIYPVKLRAYNAIYSHVAMLSNELSRSSGNSVELYAAGNSEVNCDLVSVHPQHMSNGVFSEDEKKYYLHLLISKCFANASKYDIVHSHFNILSLFYSNLVTSTPVVNSIHSPIKDELKPIILQFKNANFISFSLAQRKFLPELNWVGNIYHGVDTNVFTFNDKPKDYVLFLGRITKDKGVHLAIEAAKKAGIQIIIAGKSYPNEGYWHDEIEKHVDGKKVRYVGEADFDAKIEYLRNAKALLMPVQWEEPFGMVMIEAMACGTPVIGFRRGAIPEIVSDKKTGYVVDDVSGMTKAIKNINKISREEVRKRAENFFSVKKMVSGYQKVYKRVIEEYKFKNKK